MSDTQNPLEAQPINLVRNKQEVGRHHALGAATSLVDYFSHGNILVIGNSEKALAQVIPLAPLKVTVLEIKPELSRPQKQLTDTGIIVFQSKPPSISGHLGAFKVLVMDNDLCHDLAVMNMTDTGSFDLVLDLSETPLITARLPPFGYYSASSDGALATALEQLPELVGEFDKPRYFDYNGEVCAHSRSNLKGCSRCIDVCSTDAISSRGEGIEVNPFLCQGCGSCATVCPSGAMTYAWPRPADAIDRTRALLEQNQNNATVLLLYAQTDNETYDAAFEQILPVHVIAVAVEEVSAFGIDYWATLLAAGIRQIVVLVSSDPEDPSTHALLQQSHILQAILDGVRSLNANEIADENANASVLPTFEFIATVAETSVGSPAARQFPALIACLEKTAALPATTRQLARFSTHNDKRQTLRMAVDALCSGMTPGEAMVELPAGSPFGEVKVDADNCTLCMACVSVCPAGALLDGQELPKLRFIESNCVQCGLCEQACPEQVISLTPRFILDSTEARNVVTLNEEQPFHCLRCHKAFATQKMIQTMSGKLAGHWMFSDEKALRRLKMCEDCRVKDMFEDESGGIEVHRS